MFLEDNFMLWRTPKTELKVACFRFTPPAPAEWGPGSMLMTDIIFDSPYISLNTTFTTLLVRVDEFISMCGIGITMNSGTEAKFVWKITKLPVLSQIVIEFA
jgi:hypothetical protein